MKIFLTSVIDLPIIHYNNLVYPELNLKKASIKKARKHKNINNG